MLSTCLAYREPSTANCCNTSELAIGVHADIEQQTQPPFSFGNKVEIAGRRMPEWLSR